MHNFLDKHFTDEEIELIEKSQKARIDAQYYSDRDISDELYERMTNNAALFLARCKEVLNDLTEEEIENIRNNLFT